jgi:hypothetical protein
MSALERKSLDVEDEEVHEVKLTSLNSILDDDNAIEQVKFHGAISEQTELKKILGKRSRRQPKIETLEITKREIRPKYTDDVAADDIREKLT